MHFTILDIYIHMMQNYFYVHKFSIVVYATGLFGGCEETHHASHDDPRIQINVS